MSEKSLTERTTIALGLVPESAEPSSIHEIVRAHLAESFPALTPEAEHSPELAQALVRSDEYAKQLITILEDPLTDPLGKETAAARILLGLDQKEHILDKNGQPAGGYKSFDGDRSLPDLLENTPPEYHSLLIFNILITAINHKTSAEFLLDAGQRTLYIADLIKAAELSLINKNGPEKINTSDTLVGLGRVIQTLTPKLTDLNPSTTILETVQKKLLATEPVSLVGSSSANAIFQQTETVNRDQQNAKALAGLSA